tara:strand:- start:32503 stop:32712 length:210 start_codon:yes stop_codon:yes gene_type:complete
MRRKNRQFKITCDVPAECQSDEDFAFMLQDTFDSNNWNCTVLDEHGEKQLVPVGKVNFSEFELGPEGEE